MSFWELVVVAVVALVVLGPEKLPGAIRSVSRFIGGIKQFGQQMKAELSDELRAHELHQKLKEAEEKGLLGLTSEEMAAIAELRQAAAEVNNPYGHSQVAKPSIAHPEIVQSEIAQSEVVQSEIAQSKAILTGSAQSDRTQPEVPTTSPQLVSQDPHERKNPS